MCTTSEDLVLSENNAYNKPTDHYWDVFIAASCYGLRPCGGTGRQRSKGLTARDGGGARALLQAMAAEPGLRAEAVRWYRMGAEQGPYCKGCRRSKGRYCKGWRRSKGLTAYFRDNEMAYVPAPWLLKSPITDTAGLHEVPPPSLVAPSLI